MDRVVMSMEKHLKFIHLCGRTGEEVELIGDFCLTTCEILKDCLMNHCVKPADLLTPERYEWSVNRLIKIARQGKI